MDPDQLEQLIAHVVSAALADGMPVDGLTSLKIDFGADGVKLTATPESGEAYEAEMGADEVAAALGLEVDDDAAEEPAAPKPAEKSAEKPATPAASETQKV